MRIANIFLLLLGFIFVFTACKKEEAEPQCPECWDQKAVCVDAVCQCPEGSIEVDQTGMRGIWKADSLLDEVPQTYCLQPDPLAFLAEFDSLGCYRTMAVFFPADPWRFEEEWTSPFAPMAKPGLPSNVRLSTSMWLTVKDEPEGKYVKIENLVGTVGWVFAYGCADMDFSKGDALDDITTGGMSADFEGYMVDENTIEGELILKASGTYEEEYDGQRKAITFVRTTAM
ncbi:MAG: hypothetical protein RIC19_09990 [Phaeodactylibacter sp.]|uniref:hypothetical protein n=1 Tax=Phaeodactylibacter sp. TaxID=1940289 RepID=UPI0032EBEBF4